MTHAMFNLVRPIVFGVAAVLAAAVARADASERPLPAAFGRHTDPPAEAFTAARSFGADERIVGTYYFYWYDDATKLHVVDHDGSDALTTHPPRLERFSYKSAAWHEQQLRDMMAAGIDFVLPVFWGAPSEHAPDAMFHWSYAGMAPLVEARQRLLDEGLDPPAIGLFYDTSTLEHNSWGVHVDCTTPYGRQWFYATVRDFFSMIPARHWAMIDGRPIVLLYSAAFAKGYDQSVIDYTKEQFAREFAGRIPYIAPEVSWKVAADDKVAWGGALGLKQPGIASLGPGYDHAAVPDRTPLVVDRRGGDFYGEQWQKLLQQPANIVMIETWNELHEGTDIAESREYGRKFIELTRRYVEEFKGRKASAAPPEGSEARPAP